MLRLLAAGAAHPECAACSTAWQIDDRMQKIRKFGKRSKYANLRSGGEVSRGVCDAVWEWVDATYGSMPQFAAAVHGYA